MSSIVSHDSGGQREPFWRNHGLWAAKPRLSPKRLIKRQPLANPATTNAYLQRRRNDLKGVRYQVRTVSPSRGASRLTEATPFLIGVIASEVTNVLRFKVGRNSKI